MKTERRVSTTGISKARIALLTALVALLPLTASLPACGGEVTTSADPAVSTCRDVILENAKILLTRAEYTEARLEFERLLECAPGDDEGMFGWSVSWLFEELNKAVESVLQIISLAGSLKTADRAVLLQKLAADIDGAPIRMDKEGIGALLDAILGRYETDLIVIRDFYHQIALNPEFNFRIDSMPLVVAGIKLLDLGAEYDLGEIHFGLGIIEAALGTINVILSLDYGLDLVDMIIFLTNEGAALVSDANAENIQKVIAYVFEHNPYLLKLDKDVGNARFVEAGANYGRSMAGFIDGIAFMRSEPEFDLDQSDDMIGYINEDGTDTLVFSLKYAPENIFVQMADENMLPEGIKVPISNDIFATFERIRDNLLVPGSPRVSWADDVAPIIGLAVFVVLSTGVLDSIIQSAAGGMEGDFDVNSLLNPEFLSEDVITSLITGIIPDIFEFDIGYFFANPVEGGFRTLLPAWTVTREEGENVFIFEYECGLGDGPGQLNSADSLVPGFLCPAPGDFPGAVVDQPHFLLQPQSFGGAEFPASPYADDLPEYEAGGAIEADGIDSPIPYILFQDPSLHGMLYTDLTPYSDGNSQINDTDDEFSLTDNFELNAIIAVIAGDIVGLISSF